MSLLFRPRRPPPPEGLLPGVAAARRASLDVEYSDVELAGDAHVVDGTGWAEWVVTARHAGRQITLRGITVVELSGDQARCCRHYWDELGLLDRLGSLHQDERKIP